MEIRENIKKYHKNEREYERKKIAIKDRKSGIFRILEGNTENIKEETDEKFEKISGQVS